VPRNLVVFMSSDGIRDESAKPSKCELKSGNAIEHRSLSDPFLSLSQAGRQLGSRRLLEVFDRLNFTPRRAARCFSSDWKNAAEERKREREGEAYFCFRGLISSPRRERKFAIELIYLSRTLR